MKLNVSIVTEEGFVLEDLLVDSEGTGETNNIEFALMIREVIENHFDTSEAT